MRSVAITTLDHFTHTVHVHCLVLTRIAFSNLFETHPARTRTCTTRVLTHIRLYNVGGVGAVERRRRKKRNYEDDDAGKTAARAATRCATKPCTHPNPAPVGSGRGLNRAIRTHQTVRVTVHVPEIPHNVACPSHMHVFCAKPGCCVLNSVHAPEQCANSVLTAF